MTLKGMGLSTLWKTRVARAAALYRVDKRPYDRAVRDGFDFEL